MKADARGWRLALVPDALVNPPAVRRTAPDVLQLLEDSGYGLLQLPPPGRHAPLLAVIADQVAEYAHHGYAIVALGVYGDTGGLHWRRLAALLRHRGISLPPRHMLRRDREVAAESRRLAAFLARYDLPTDVQRRWRV
ncbi:MAG: hypothetical protein JO341_10790 [Gammaproteobacteria bacterium]|nr:hypothetical protein [Gammaproteobacteria bacterium]